MVDFSDFSADISLLDRGIAEPASEDGTVVQYTGGFYSTDGILFQELRRCYLYKTNDEI
jgi:hypothetical protein